MSDAGDVVAYTWAAIGCLVYFLLNYVTAPFGRHSSLTWGPTMNNKMGWFVMEIPSLLIMLSSILILYASVKHVSYVWIPYLLWIAHYTNRSIIYPYRIQSTPKPMPILIAFCAIGFNFVNATLNSIYLFNHASRYDLHWFAQPSSLLGFGLFLLGATINCYYDNKLIDLRSNGNTGYIIPQGSLFEYISCPNLFGECVEWTGFALLTWNSASFSFALWTWANLVPRAVSHHMWYKVKFEDYPKQRKAVLPFLL